MPSPSSSTDRTRTSPPTCVAASTRTVPSPWRTAFSTRLVTTWVNLSGSTVISGRPSATSSSIGRLVPAPTESTTRRDQDRGVDGSRVELQPAGVDPGDVEQLGDQPAEPVGVGADRRQHQLLLVVVELVPAVEQRLHEALHPGQRRAQLVGDRGDQVGALPVEPGPAAAGAQADRDLLDRPVQGGPVDPGDDQHLGAVGQQPGLLGDGGAGRQPVVRAVGRAPVAAVLVLRAASDARRAARPTGSRPASTPSSRGARRAVEQRVTTAWSRPGERRRRRRAASQVGAVAARPVTPTGDRRLSDAARARTA